MYHCTESVLLCKINILYMIVFRIFSFCQMETTSQKCSSALYGHRTFIPVFQNSCFGWSNVYVFSDQFSVLLSISIFAFACIKQEIQMLVINWSSPAARPNSAPKSPVYCYFCIC